MPNWVFNNFEVHGTPEGIAEFKSQVLDYTSIYTDADPDSSEPLGDTFSFHAFITPPIDKYDEYRSTNGFGPNGAYGNTEFNWQTKWDACNVEFVANSDDHLQIRFDTAWSPPIPVFEEAVEKFPGLSFYFDWEEENEWGGRARGECGEFAITQEWDTPTSHADYEALGKECDSCVLWNTNDPEEWYDDCPDKAEQIAKQQMENKMVNNTITVTGADVSVGEVVESFMTNDSINDETLYEVNSVEVYGIDNDGWDRLTGADIQVETKGGLTNEYIDPIREQFPAVDIEVVNDTPIA